MSEEKQEQVASPEPIVGSPEIHFEPLVKLKEVEIQSLEDREQELLKMRAKLYRFTIDDEDGPQWKERGTGEVKILKHNDTGSSRLLMRRDKTLKMCANHALISGMDLKPHGNSEKAFVWVTEADFADLEEKKETLAIRLANKEAAKEFKETFDRVVKEQASKETKLEDKLSDLTVNDSPDKDCQDSKQNENPEQGSATENGTKAEEKINGAKDS